MTLLFVIVASLVAIIAKRYRKISNKKQRTIWLSVIALLILPALYFGWVGIVYIVMGISLLITLAGGAFVWFIPIIKEKKS